MTTIMARPQVVVAWLVVAVTLVLLLMTLV